MSEVTLQVGGRSYKVACADGEEAHVARLGATIDARLRSMGSLASQDAQNLLFAALLLADEIHEHDKSQGAADTALAEAEAARARAEAARTALADRVEQMGTAHRESQQALNEHAARLDQTAGENERLAAELASVREAADRAADRAAALEAEIADLRSAPPAPTRDPELAPALERFADLLENCADKLERSGQAS
jgi:cell division protein ZapA